MSSLDPRPFPQRRRSTLSRIIAVVLELVSWRISVKDVTDVVRLKVHQWHALDLCFPGYRLLLLHGPQSSLPGWVSTSFYLDESTH